MQIIHPNENIFQEFDDILNSGSDDIIKTLESFHKIQ